MINWSPLSRSPGSHRAIKCVKCLPLTMPDMTTRMTIIPWFPLCITLFSLAGHEICGGKLFPPQASAPEEFPTHSAPPWPRPALPVAIIKRTCTLPRAASLGKEQSVSLVSWKQQSSVGTRQVHPTAAPPDSTGYCKSC